MHRQPLLIALERYLQFHPDESEMVIRFRDFVVAHPRCFERGLEHPGHVTGSAWIVDPDGDAVLLTHHRKLDLWIQLGGHADKNPDVLAVARREGLEESGLNRLDVLSGEGSGPVIPFDVDIHDIPARRSEPAHVHFDVRFAFRAVTRDVVTSDESHALAWVPLTELATYTRDSSVLRMATKWQRMRSAAGGV